MTFPHKREKRVIKYVNLDVLDIRSTLAGTAVHILAIVTAPSGSSPFISDGDEEETMGYIFV